MKTLSVRKSLLVLIDIFIFLVTYTLIVFVATKANPQHVISVNMKVMNAVVLLLPLFFVRLLGRIYSNMWRFADSKTYLHMIAADLIGGALGLVISYLFLSSRIGVWKITTVVAFFDLATLASRFLYQQYYRHSEVSVGDLNKVGVAIVGAGQTGSFLAKELLYSSASHFRPVCFIDIDKTKIGNRVCGLKVYAEDENILKKLRSMPVQEIFIAIPSISNETTERLHRLYNQSGCTIKMYDLSSKDGSLGIKKRAIREIKIDDLLFRESLNICNAETQSYYSNKVVLVTGGGGSIGSEICRQIAKCHPKRLIIFDSYENNAYEIQQELISIYGAELDLIVEIGSVRDRRRLSSVFSAHLPQIVFHAAAHKHVPLMEHSFYEAIKNNIFGTYNTADISEKYGAEKFILISTDKAVNPTSIMGATKRICEMVVLSRTDSMTSFSSVRFGNVIGSNGSVIPLFRKQIERGGPITITDKSITRYFMSIPEAAQLVIQAGNMAKSGELFVLDMGKPIKILELAEKMIQLSGLRPYEDIDIVEVGLRPGEKLYEEPLTDYENLRKTGNDLIYVDSSASLTRIEVEAKLVCLKTALETEGNSVSSEKIRQVLKTIVPTYLDSAKEMETLSAQVKKHNPVSS